MNATMPKRATSLLDTNAYDYAGDKSHSDESQLVWNLATACLLIFVCFRIFDVFKIFPANYFDKQLYSGFGVILDDIIAGMYTILTMIIINVFI